MCFYFNFKWPAWIRCKKPEAKQSHKWLSFSAMSLLLFSTCLSFLFRKLVFLLLFPFSGYKYFMCFVCPICTVKWLYCPTFSPLFCPKKVKSELDSILPCNASLVSRKLLFQFSISKHLKCRCSPFVGCDKLSCITASFKRRPSSPDLLERFPFRFAS